MLADASGGATIRGDLILSDGKTIGIATGKTYAYYENRMISLGFIDTEYAKEGDELVTLWGPSDKPQKEIRATVARFPYYDGEFRNERFDVEKIPHRKF
ncbi:glycine cleavage T C-terminal barrel domain-containing protein [Eubacteriaceae bacterium ES2]|nr:glycine cleavage T C-terminal barrel domain-containing protein [Eubacteriaceae bacterium ES2]